MKSRAAPSKALREKRLFALSTLASSGCHASVPGRLRHGWKGGLPPSPFDGRGNKMAILKSSVVLTLPVQRYRKWTGLVPPSPIHIPGGYTAHLIPPKQPAHRLRLRVRCLRVPVPLRVGGSSLFCPLEYSSHGCLIPTQGKYSQIATWYFVPVFHQSPLLI